MNSKGRTFLTLLAFLAIAILTSPPAAAQTSGRLSGTVLDQSGAPVSGASVSVSVENGGVAATATTAVNGVFSLTGLAPGDYDLTLEAKGFQKTILKRVKIASARETSLPPVTLEVAALVETVEVAEAIVGVQTTNAEVATTVQNDQFRLLPQLNRSPQALLITQPGVTYNYRQYTTINGLRPSYSNITMDGINIQDNFIRQNTVDWAPNALLTDQVAEVTISTSNTNAGAGGGAAQVSYITPSGNNDFKGALYWFNRNNKFAANSWFNNRDGIGLPFLNQNQIGGRVGGPLVKNKLFYYGNYEAFRNHQQTTANRTLLTADARQGIFTYEDASGAVRKVNVLQAAGKPVDSVIQDLLGKLPPASAINNYRVGDSRENLLRNTAGYSFVIRDNRIRDNVTTKVDYILSDRNTITGSYLWNRDLDDRADATYNFSSIPKVILRSTTRLLSLGWRTNPIPSLTNEVRGGFNLSEPVFKSDEQLPKFFVGSSTTSATLIGNLFTNPINSFMDQGRYVDTYNFNDNAAWFKGNHDLQFGGSVMLQRVNPFNAAGIIPTYAVGIGSGQQGLDTALLPGIRSNDVTPANNLLASLAGLLNQQGQTFNVTSRTSGFVAGAPDSRNFTLDTYALYFADKWKIVPRLTLTLGLRYEYLTTMDERDSLALLPVVSGGNPINTMFGNATLDFAGKSAGRPWYNPDRNNFAPNIGLAWDVRGNGKTAVRLGYSVNYVNDSHMTAVRNTIITNSGLAQSVARTGLSGTLSGASAIPAPTFKVPRTFEDNYRLNPTGAFGIIDPGLATPYVQQWNLSIQQDLLGGVFDLRYVGNKVTKALRAFDYNQVLIREFGFLEDFLRARKNGELARAATGTFNPAYNPAIAGSQPLTVFPQLGSGGLLTNASVRSYIETGQVGELGYWYQIQGLRGPFTFFRNPLSLGLNMMTNYSNQSYNALQADWSRRMSRGVQVQVNYTYAKVMSDAAGTEQAQFEAFLDINNAKLERARTPFDVTHSFKNNWVYGLPFGAGKRWSGGGAVDKVIGGWSVAGIMTWQSGSPFSIQSLRATLNRSGRSTGQNGTTASTNVDKARLDEIVSFRMTGNGPYFVAASAIGTDGRGVAADGRAPFDGQVFFNPDPGTVGGLQRRMFSGPSWFNLDFGLLKETRITERYSVELRMESTNLFNQVTWYLGDLDINSTSFGRITSTLTSPRRIQFGLYLRF